VPTRRLPNNIYFENNTNYFTCSALTTRPKCRVRLLGSGGRGTIQEGREKHEVGSRNILLIVPLIWVIGDRLERNKIKKASLNYSKDYLLCRI